MKNIATYERRFTRAWEIEEIGASLFIETAIRSHFSQAKADALFRHPNRSRHRG